MSESTSPTPNDSFIVEQSARLAEFLYKLTLHCLLSKTIKILPSSGRSIDWYVLIFATASILAFVVTFLTFKIGGNTQSTTYFVLTSIAFWRVYEIFIYQLLVLFVHQHRAGPDYKWVSYQRGLLLVGINYVETIFWFATLYSIMAHLGWIQVPSPAVLSILRESIGLMVANATGNFTFVSPSTYAGYFSWSVLTTHVSIGLFLTIVIVSRFVSLLPRPGTMSGGETPDKK